MWTQGHRDTGTQGHRDTGTQGHRDTGTQGHRDTGTQGHRGSFYALLLGLGALSPLAGGAIPPAYRGHEPVRFDAWHFSENSNRILLHGDGVEVVADDAARAYGFCFPASWLWHLSDALDAVDTSFSYDVSYAYFDVGDCVDRTAGWPGEMASRVADWNALMASSSTKDNLKSILSTACNLAADRTRPWPWRTMSCPGSCQEEWEPWLRITSAGGVATDIDLDGAAECLEIPDSLEICLPCRGGIKMLATGWDCAIGLGTAKRMVLTDNYLDNIAFDPGGARALWTVRAIAKNEGIKRSGWNDLIPPPIVAGVVGCAVDLCLAEDECSLLDGWSVGRFGDGSRLEVFSEGRGGIFGVLSGVRSSKLASNDNLNCVKALNDWHLAKIGSHSTFLARPSAVDSHWLPMATWHYENSNAAIAGLASNLGGHRHELINRWSMDSIGSDNVFQVLARDRSSVFGLLANMGPKNGICGGNDWSVGSIANENLFSSSAGVATVFGLANSIGGINMGELLNRWQFAGIGSANTFLATSTGTTAVGDFSGHPAVGTSNFSFASVFGLVSDMGTGQASSLLSGWQFGKIGNGNQFLASACDKELSHASIFGLVTKMGCGGLAPDATLLDSWKFEGFGHGNRFAVQSSGAAGIFALLADCGFVTMPPTANCWHFGKFGKDNVFSAIADVSSSGYSSSYAGIFGTLCKLGCYSSSSAFANWSFDGFGDGCRFDALAKGRSVSDSSTAGAGIFGLQIDVPCSSTFNGWHFGKFGKDNVFSAIADVSSFAYSSSYAGIFGTLCKLGCYSSSSAFSNWSFDGFGDGCRFDALAKGRSVSGKSTSTAGAGIFGLQIDAFYPNAFNGWHFGKFGKDNVFSANADVSSSGNYSPSYAGIFGTLCKLGCNSSFSAFSNWSFDGFGDGCRFDALAKGRSVSGSSTAGAGIFGLQIDAFYPNAFNGWHFGKFGKDNVFSAIADVSSSGNYSPSYAGIFGTLCKLGCYSSSSAFSNWSFDGFGDGCRFDALAKGRSVSGNTAGAGIFGLQIDAFYPNAFNGWHFGKFGRDNVFSATADVSSCGCSFSWASIFGTLCKLGCNSSSSAFSDWSFDGFGDGCRFDAAATAMATEGFASEGIAATVGAGIFGLQIDAPCSNTFNGWHLGKFSNDNIFRADAFSSLSSSFCNLFSSSSYASIFGTLCKLGCDSSSSAFNNWSFDGFGDGNDLRTCARATSGIGGASIFALRLDGGADGGCFFLGWKIGLIGLKSRFMANVQNTDTVFASNRGEAYAGIFGTMARVGFSSSNPFCGWTFDGFGRRNTFSATALSKIGKAFAGIFSTVCETGFSNSNPFSDWFVGDIGDGGSFSSVASGGAQAFATVFGSGFHTGHDLSGKLFCNWSVELHGSQSIAALSFAPKAWDSNVAAFGGAENSNMRFYLNTKGTFRPTAVNILAAKLANGWNFPSWETGLVLSPVQDDNIDWVAEKADDVWQIVADNTGNGWGFPAESEKDGWFASANSKLWLVDSETNQLVACNGSLLVSGNQGFEWLLANDGRGGWVRWDPDESVFLTTDGVKIAYEEKLSAWFQVDDSGQFITTSNEPIKYANFGEESAWYKYYANVDGRDIYTASDSDYTAYDEDSGSWKKVDAWGQWLDDDDFSVDDAANAADATPITAAPISKTALIFDQVDTGDRARALALGQNFQFNVGQRRATATFVDGEGIVRPMETEESVAVGGFTAGGAGTLNLIGAVSRAAYASSTAGSRLRIDAGWTVNCFSPVRDVESTEILHGRMVLMANDMGGRAALQSAIEQLQANICIAMDEVIDGKPVARHYGGDENVCGYAGGVQLDANSYPILGRLTIASSKDQRLLFGTALHGSGLAHHIAGQLVLKGSGTNTFGPQLQLWDGGPVFGLKLARTGGDTFLGPVNAPVVVMENVTDVVAGELISVADHLPVRGNQLVDAYGRPTDYYFILGEDDASLSTDLLLDMASGYGYAADAAAKLRLLWLDSATQKGLVIASVEEGIILKSTLDPVLPPPQQFEDDDITGWIHSRFFGGELARMLLAANDLQFSHLRNHCGDILGSDPFVSVLGARMEQRQTKRAAAFSSKLHGLMLGEDWVRSMAGATLLRRGICVAHVNGRLRGIDLPDPLAKSTHQRTTFATAFMALEHRNAKQLKRNAMAAITLGSGRGKTWRTDGDGDTYWGKVASTFAAIRCEGTVNLLRCYDLQIGPWGGISHVLLHQGRHVERGNGWEPTTTPSLAHQFCNTLLGINLEHESSRLLHLCCRLAVNWQAIRHQRRDGPVAIAGTDLDSFSPRLALGDRISCHVATSLRQRVGEHWNFSASWQGNFGGRASYSDLSLTAGYAF